jgi:hypothetical protein
MKRHSPGTDREFTFNLWRQLPLCYLLHHRPELSDLRASNASCGAAAREFRNLNLLLTEELHGLRAVAACRFNLSTEPGRVVGVNAGWRCPLEPRENLEISSADYRSAILPLNYPGTVLFGSR